MWIDYTRKIDASDPLAVLQYRDSRGRHASECYVFQRRSQQQWSRIQRCSC